MALNKEQQALRDSYQFVNISEEEFIELYRRAKNTETKTKEAFDKEMHSYLENNIDTKTMENFISNLKINPKSKPIKIKQSLNSFFSFLESIEYTLTNENAKELLKLPIFQSLFAQVFEENTMNSDKLTEEIGDNTNYEILIDMYMEENNIITKEEEDFDAENMEEVELLSEEEMLSGVSIEDPVRMYLKEIGRHPLLNATEELELTKSIAEHSKKLEGYYKLQEEKEEKFYQEQIELLEEQITKEKKKMTEANLRLVVSIAKRYVGRGMLFLDLIQEGNLGLIKAIDKYDYKKGYKFSTYANWWIRQAMTRAIADQARTIRIPVHMVDTINKLIRTQKALSQQLGREATPKEIAEEMGLKEKRVEKILKYAQEPVSLDKPVGEEEDGFLGDFVPDEEANFIDTILLNQIKEMLEKYGLSSLTTREEKVIRLRFGLDDGKARTLEEVGKEFHVTRERIRQIEAKALKKLRHPSKTKKYNLFEDNNDYANKNPLYIANQDKEQEGNSKIKVAEIHPKLTLPLLIDFIKLLPSEAQNLYCSQNGIIKTSERLIEPNPRPLTEEGEEYLNLISQEIEKMVNIYFKISKETGLTEKTKQLLIAILEKQSLPFALGIYNKRRIEQGVCSLKKEDENIIRSIYSERAGFNEEKYNQYQDRIPAILHKITISLEQTSNTENLYRKVQVVAKPIKIPQKKVLEKKNPVKKEQSDSKPVTTTYNKKYYRPKTKEEKIKNSFVGQYTKEEVLFVLPLFKERERIAFLLHHGRKLDDYLKFPETFQGKSKKYYQQNYSLAYKTGKEILKGKMNYLDMYKKRVELYAQKDEMTKAQLFRQYVPICAPILSSVEVEIILNLTVDTLLSINPEIDAIEAMILKIANKYKKADNKEAIYQQVKNRLVTLLEIRMQLEGIEAKEKIEQLITTMLEEWIKADYNDENLKRQMIKYLKGE